MHQIHASELRFQSLIPTEKTNPIWHAGMRQQHCSLDNVFVKISCDFDSVHIDIVSIDLRLLQTNSVLSLTDYYK